MASLLLSNSNGYTSCAQQQMEQQQQNQPSSSSGATAQMIQVDEDLRDRMEVMFWQESTHYRTCDYLACGGSVVTGPGGSEKNESLVNEQWRSRMLEWAYQLVDHFDMPRSVVGVCMNNLDRYLESYFVATATPEDGPRMQKKRFQVLTMTCLYVAMKLNCQARIPVEYMVQLSRGVVTVSELKTMEMDVLNQLSWLVHPPTAFDFLKHYLQLLLPNFGPSSSSGDNNNSAVVAHYKKRFQAIEDLASFLVELSVLDYFFVSHRPSTVAIAALLNAIQEDPHNIGQMQQGHQDTILGFDINAFILPGEHTNVYHCRQRLACLYQNTGVSADDVLDDDDDQMASSNAIKPEDDARTASPVSVANVNQHPHLFG